MRNNAKKYKPVKGDFQSALLPVLNGTLSAAALTVIAVLLIAVLLRYKILPETAIPIANQIVKVAGVAIAAFISTRTPCKMPFMRGMFSGMLYIIAGILIFSSIAQVFEPSIANLSDAIMGAIIGAVVALVLGKKTE